MKLFIIAVTFLFTSSLSHAVLAENNIQYNYGELRYVFDSDIDDTDLDGDGFGFGGSIRLDELFYVIADHETIGYDFGNDLSMLQGGLGVIFSAKKFDAIGELTLIYADADSDLNDYDGTGYRLSGGARFYVSPKLELRGLLSHRELDKDDTFFTISGDYFINNTFSINASKDISAELDRFSIGLRYYIGK